MPAGVLAAYRAETARLVRQRLGWMASLFVLLVGASVLIEYAFHPDRVWAILTVYPAEIAACVLALAAVRLGANPIHIATALAATLSVLLTLYIALVGGPVERVATGQVCLLSGVVILLPWGWRPQLLVSGVVLASLLLAAPHLSQQEGLTYATLALVTGGTTSVFGALFLDRYRREAFVRTALLDEAKRRTEEEAEIAAALLHVGQELSAHLGGPDVLRHVNRLTAQVLGTDYSSTYIWDAREHAFRLHADVGATADVHAEAEEILINADSVPLVRTLRPGQVVEIEDVHGPGPVLGTLMRRWQIASIVAAPICRGADMVGLLVAGHRQRTGSFSARERRLILGIAHAAAVTLENARLIDRLQSANRLKTEFVSTMSHELRTPLNVILGYTDMARDDRLPEGEWRTCLARIDAAGRELLELIEGTLEIGRIEAGHDEVRLEAVSLPAFWEELGHGCARMPRRNGVRLEWTAAPAGSALVTDPRKLAVVVRNLVGNALKFTERGVVQTEVATRGDQIVLRVVDTGIGIPPEDQAAIFEMFRQVDGSDRRRYGGTGLGLYITRRFVQQLGGTIVVESVPGVGSTFTVVLPLRQSQPPARRAA